MIARLVRTLSALLLALSTVLPAADWPQFLGADRDGRSPEKIASAFPEAGPRILWTKPVGHGLAGPVVAGDAVYLFHRDGGQALLEAFSAVEGASRWRHAYPTGYRDDFGFDDGPRSPPTIAGGRLFAYGAEGRLTCLDAESGELRWTRDLAAEFEAPKGWFGRCCAPLVADGRVILNLGGRHEGRAAGVAAFAVADGKLLWTGSADEASYSSPILTKIQGQERAIFFTRKGLELLEPASGRGCFKAVFEPEISASISACTPVVCGTDRVFLSGCYGMGARLWTALPDGRMETTWIAQDSLDSHYGTPVFLDGHLYGFHGRQEQGQELRCLSTTDGVVRWGFRLPAGTVLAADRTLVVLTEKGELLLGPATPAAFKPTGRGQILGAVTRAFPALANARLYARDGKNLVAIDLSAR